MRIAKNCKRKKMICAYDIVDMEMGNKGLKDHEVNWFRLKIQKKQTRKGKHSMWPSIQRIENGEFPSPAHSTNTMD